jgi:CMP-N,N'-diacetyllegionaminic acid synthase
MRRILVLIPARAGSVRIPDKNKRLLGGRPLIDWTLKVVKDKFFDSDIVVSSDDDEILELASGYGYYNSQKRTSDLATSTASLADVAFDVIERMQNVHEYYGILLLQPTTPFRTVRRLSELLDFINISPAEPCVAVSNVHTRPTWMFNLTGTKLQPLLNDENLIDLINHSHLVGVNGYAYYVPISTLISERTFIPANSNSFVIDDIIETIDIDYEYEFDFARQVAERIL